MKCLRCLNEMKLVAEKQTPRKSICYRAISLTYRDYYYCQTCDKSFVARVNLRTECENPYQEINGWKA